MPGSTRIGWDQQAADASELADFRFVIYIDNTRTELPGASCSPPATSAGFSCEATLPGMSPGQHTIQLASYLVGDVILESAKSAPLTITVSGSGSATPGGGGTDTSTSTPQVPAPSTVRDLVTSDGVGLHTAVAAAVTRPSALSVAGDGTLVIGDRQGTVVVQRDGVSIDTALGGASVLGIALDPAFTRSHLVVVLDLVPGDPATFRVARYREAGGRLGERAVLLDGVPSARETPSGAIAFGSDARLFVALDDGGDPENAPRAASYNGKVLRLDLDGRTPADQPGGSPMYAADVHAPRGLAWDADTTSLWLADASAPRLTRLRTRERRTTTTQLAVPLTPGPAAVAVYRGSAIPSLAGNLLITPLEDSPALLRVRLSGDRLAATEPLTLLGSGALRAVTVGPDGTIYALTDDAVVKVTAR